MGSYLEAPPSQDNLPVLLHIREMNASDVRQDERLLFTIMQNDKSLVKEIVKW